MLIMEDEKQRPKLARCEVIEQKEEEDAIKGIVQRVGERKRKWRFFRMVPMACLEAYSLSYLPCGRGDF